MKKTAENPHGSSSIEYQVPRVPPTRYETVRGEVDEQVGGKRKNPQEGDGRAMNSDEHLVGRFKRVHLMEPQEEGTAVDSGCEQDWGNTLYLDVNRMLGEAHRDMLSRSHQ
jgi:hypothetical protein